MDRACPDQRPDESTLLVKQGSGPYPALAVDGRGSSVVPDAGAVVLLRTAEAVGVTAALSEAVAPWRRPLGRHDPGKVLLDLAAGGDGLADVAELRAHRGGTSPGVSPLVAAAR